MSTPCKDATHEAFQIHISTTKLFSHQWICGRRAHNSGGVLISLRWIPQNCICVLFQVLTAYEQLPQNKFSYSISIQEASLSLFKLVVGATTLNSKRNRQMFVHRPNQAAGPKRLLTTPGFMKRAYHFSLMNGVNNI